MAKKKNKESKKDKTGKKAKLDVLDTAKLESFEDEIKRLNRVVGQIEGISSMLSKQRNYSDVLIQFKAVHSALKSVEQRIFDAYVHVSVEDIVAAEKRKAREVKIAELQQLFKTS